ncbi:MAG: DUF4382 domain-containing protein [Nitrospirae bacterium]|nr:DUF4382 domain-containing protein [Candidatus Manganitrophaceae bacterium]
MMRDIATRGIKKILFCSFLFVQMIFISCGAGGNGSSASAPPTSANPTGLMSVSFTDGPGDYDHVWITVKEVRFHTSDASGPDEPGWLKFPLAAPVTVDLIALGNGSAPQSIWSNLTLPVGNYQQIRLLLVPTFASSPPAAHSYFNEVVIGSNTFPLRIPDAQHGIKLAGALQVTAGGALHLAVDFDAGEDIIDFRNGVEYVLKPRLTYFDLDDVGAIVGRIDAAAAGQNGNARFVFKAEQLSADGKRHVVRRYSTLSDATGQFVIYPLPSGPYDLLMRGINYETVIIKNVPVTKGTTPTTNPTVVPPITMAAGADYTVTASITSPTGAWVNFYQTLPGAGEVPYEVRFRHFNPLTGEFVTLHGQTSTFKLSNSPIRVGTYSSSAIQLTDTPPQEGVGGYQAVADALLYDRSDPQSVNAAAPTVAFGALTVTTPWTGHSIAGTITVHSADQNKMNRGVLFAVHGGMIIDALNLDAQMLTGGSYTLANVPGGRPAAFYGVEAAGWSSTVPITKAVALPAAVDLRSGNATGVDMEMIVLP